MIGSYAPWPIATGGAPAKSGSQPSTVGTNPENATIPAGRGRSVPSPSAKLITAPCEKPPSTVRSSGTGSASSHSDASRYDSWNVSVSG